MWAEVQGYENDRENTEVIIKGKVAQATTEAEETHGTHSPHRLQD